jgi:hypothetical protein
MHTECLPVLKAGDGAVARGPTFLDALVALGDRGRIEAEAPKWLKPGIYAEPFALRALGVVREDEQLLNEAVAHFEAMGLEWHASETQKLRS